MTYLFEDPSATRAAESLDGVVLALLHLRLVSLRAVHLDDRYRFAGNTILAAVNRIWRDGMAVQVADGFDYCMHEQDEQRQVRLMGTYLGMSFH
mgnify:CR=1 FL=1